MSGEARKTGRRCAMQIPSVFIEKPDGAEYPVALSLDQSSDNRQDLGQWGSGKNQLENVEDGLAGKQARVVLAGQFVRPNRSLRPSPYARRLTPLRRTSLLPF